MRAKTYNKLFPLALGIVLGSAPMRLAMADGLQPCDSRAAGFDKDLPDDLKGSSPGQVLLSYLDLPGLSTGWGFQIVRSGERYLLRTVQFRRDMRGGTIELRPGVFGWNPVQPDPLVRAVSLSRSLAEKLRAVATAEIAQADQANARMGLDGEGFYYYTEGKCAWAWSPDPGTKPERLADIFQDLKTQPLLPTRLAQLFWEKRVIARLNQYTGSAAMPLYDYLIVMAAGVAVVGVAALPLLIAWIVTLIPKRAQRKLHFVLASGALSYGFTCFLAVLLLPFLLLGSQVAAEFDVDGHSDLALTLDVIVKYSVYVLLNAGLVFAIAVPIYLRRRWWPRLVAPKMG
ncbi:MAG TPA: hypothetical protein VNO32_57275 [Candidatus Acidoferrum sp.]|nr:hypothetical protein [Candidatus Acidoferrum sp.]